MRKQYFLLMFLSEPDTSEIYVFIDDDVGQIVVPALHLHEQWVSPIEEKTSNSKLTFLRKSTVNAPLDMQCVLVIDS